MGLVVRDELFGVAPAREGDRGRLEPLRRALRDALLEERLAGRPVDEALQGGWALPEMAESAVGGGQVVVAEVELGVPGFREEDLVRVGELNFLAGDLEDDPIGSGRHERSATYSVASSTRRSAYRRP